MGAVTGVHRAVGVEEHRGPVQVVVELELRQVDALHLHLPYRDEFLLGEPDDALIVLGHLGVEAFTGCARHAAESDKQRLVRPPGLGAGRGEVVVNPELGAPRIFILQHLEQLVLGKARLDKRERRGNNE